MQNSLKNESKTDLTAKALRGLSVDDFKALGATDMVYVRTLSQTQVARLVPNLVLAPGDVSYHMIFAANGDPVIITDTLGAVDEWLDGHDAERVTLH